MFSNFLAQLFLLLSSRFLWELFDQSFLQEHQVIFEGNIAFFTHIESNYKTLNHFILRLKVVQGDCVQCIKYFVVLRGELNNHLHLRSKLLFEDCILAIPGEGTCYGHVYLAVAGGADNVTDSLVELMLLKVFITSLYSIMSHLTISYQNYVF